MGDEDKDTGQIAVKELEGEKKTEMPPPQEEMMPKARFQEAMSVLQKQAASYKAEAESLKVRLTEVETERDSIAAARKVAEEDLKVALMAQGDSEEQAKAVKIVNERLDKLSKREAAADAKERKSSQDTQRAIEKERQATAKELALETGVEKATLLKFTDVNEMRAEAYRLQVEKLLGNQVAPKEGKSTTRKPGEFDSGQSSTSGGDEEFLKRYGRGEERGPAANKRAAELNKKLGYL